MGIREDVRGIIHDTIGDYVDSSMEEYLENNFNRDFYIIGYRQCFGYMAENYAEFLGLAHDYEEANEILSISNPELALSIIVYQVAEEELLNLGFNFEDIITMEKADEVMEML